MCFNVYHEIGEFSKTGMKTSPVDCHPVCNYSKHWVYIVTKAEELVYPDIRRPYNCCTLTVYNYSKVFKPTFTQHVHISRKIENI